jgi:hypothetical protein
VFLLPSAIGAIQQDPIRRIFKQASLDLQFAEKKSLVDATTGASLVTFTRASSGTFVGSDGLLRSAVTNLLLRSEEFDQWTASNITVTANNTAAPNGLLVADLLDDGTTAAVSHRVLTPVTFSATSGVAYAFSVYVKNLDRDFVQLALGSTAFGATAYANFNILAGTVGTVGASATASITALSNEWYRCTIAYTATATASDSAFIATMPSATSARNESYTGSNKRLYLWGAQLEQSSTVGEYIPTTSTINSAPRFDHNPTTGESLGLLVEESRTNSIRNNTGVGAVAGTPGTLPTNWSVAVASDLTTNVIGTGISAGVSYIDLQIVGTSNSTSYIFAFESNSQIAALQNQTWSESLWISHVAGSFANISATSLNIRQSNILGSQIAATVVTFSQPTSTLARVSGTATFSEVTTAFVTPGFRLTIANGAAIDITLRIGLPQLEQGAFVTSTILTSTTAATRAADVASISGSNFSSWYRQDEGTVFSNFLPGNLSADAVIFEVGDNSLNNRINIEAQPGTSLRAWPRITTASSLQIDIPINNVLSLTAPTRAAVAFASNNSNFAANGIVGATDTSCTIPAVDRAGIGQLNTTGGVRLNGTIRRLTFWPTRLSNSTLQGITQ